MRGKLKERIVDGRMVYLYTPESFSSATAPDGNQIRYPIIYSNNGDLDIEEFDRLFTDLEQRVDAGECCECLFAAIPPQRENDEYSPWPADSAFRGSAPFGGEGQAYLNWLTERLVPTLEADYPTLPGYRCLMGYSLGGLHALWSAFRTDCFDRYASLSGSLWFDGWDEFIAAHSLRSPSASIYLSLGASEEKSRSPRLSKVGERTRETYRLLLEAGLNEQRLILEWNRGGHFDDIPARFSRAVAWLMRPVRG